jgi:hypothetical protein
MDTHLASGFFRHGIVLFLGLALPFTFFLLFCFPLQQLPLPLGQLVLPIPPGPVTSGFSVIVVEAGFASGGGHLRDRFFSHVLFYNNSCKSSCCTCRSLYSPGWICSRSIAIDVSCRVETCKPRFPELFRIRSSHDHYRRGINYPFRFLLSSIRPRSTAQILDALAVVFYSPVFIIA